MSNKHIKSDVILIGAGIMSATLGTMLKELAPDWKIKVFENLAKAGEESSHELNNAGTGHAALCELNYTSEKKTGQSILLKRLTLTHSSRIHYNFGHT